MQPAVADSVPLLHPAHESASRCQPTSTCLEQLGQLPTACDTTLRSSLPTSAVEAAERSDTICEVVVRSCAIATNWNLLDPGLGRCQRERARNVRSPWLIVVVRR